jgi:hypothetical protein
MSLLTNYQPPPIILTQKQRGLYEFWISEVAHIYFPNLPTYTACERVKDKIKAKIGYTTSKDITSLQFQQTIQLLKAYIYMVQPNYKPKFYNN